jgi:hypothetical protein
MLTERATTPKAIDKMITVLLDELSLSAATAQWLKYRKPRCFKPELNECHINAWLQMRYEKSGSLCSGWVIWQSKLAQFVEAQFHTVWRNDEGKLVDVTPRQDGEKRILFVPDSVRAITLLEYKGQPAIKTYDNVRVQSGRLVTGLREQIHVLKTELIYEHGLAIRGG